MKRTAVRSRRSLRTIVCGTVALALFTAAAPAVSAEGADCSGQTCLEVEGSGLYVAKVTASVPADAAFYGFIQLDIAGRKLPSAVRHWHEGSKYTVALGRKVPDGTKICAEGWEKLEDNPQPRFHGRVCKVIKEARKSKG
ncbi:hypothetical protein [Streptomyces sp. NPDC053048]|uniref:hypothetical protein n=1 Tax=Streptomyces sp. NPDC053048 TaxID=3365694 RepID=UPI0037CEC474